MDVKFDINQALEQLAQAFNTTVDKLYPMLIKQAYVSGITSVLAFLITLVGILVVFKLTKRSIEKHGADYWEWTDEGVPFIFLWIIVSVICVISLVVMLCTAPTALLNPEYWALKEILSYVK